MKKIIGIASLALCLVATTTNAQEGRRQLDPSAMRERTEKQKAKLKEELKLTDAQADSVVAIQMEFLPKMRGLREFEPEERMAKMKEINDNYKARLKEALKDDKLVTKVIEFQEKQRKEMMEKMREMKPQE